MYGAPNILGARKILKTPPAQRTSLAAQEPRSDAIHMERVTQLKTGVVVLDALEANPTHVATGGVRVGRRHSCCQLIVRTLPEFDRTQWCETSPFSDGLI